MTATAADLIVSLLQKAGAKNLYEALVHLDGDLGRPVVRVRRLDELRVATRR